MVIASDRPLQFSQQRTPAPICSEKQLIRPWENSCVTRPIAVPTGYAQIVTALVAALSEPARVPWPCVGHPVPASRQSWIDRPDA
jgi:hypothetical protein